MMCTVTYMNKKIRATAPTDTSTMVTMIITPAMTPELLPPLPPGSRV